MLSGSAIPASQERFGLVAAEQCFPWSTQINNPRENLHDICRDWRCGLKQLTRNGIRKLCSVRVQEHALRPIHVLPWSAISWVSYKGEAELGAVTSNLMSPTSLNLQMKQSVHFSCGRVASDARRAVSREWSDKRPGRLLATSVTAKTLSGRLQVPMVLILRSPPRAFTVTNIPFQSYVTIKPTVFDIVDLPDARFLHIAVNQGYVLLPNFVDTLVHKLLAELREGPTSLADDQHT
mmetsp:Transcript_31557/g.84276  ORF Transcript_31557/g.84276 Transcript_31557/m.84276 type:complete len:236 (-) Transcript_31557:766-1473(-)